MKDKFKPGDKKTFKKIVTGEDTAVFQSGAVHPVYATFALARDAEWACRLFVLEMKDEDEEGIGTMLTIDHLSPALVGSEIIFEAIISEIKGNSIICEYTASVGERLIARGRQGQKILKKDRVNLIFAQLQPKSR
ncbi:MAG: hypothetical protein M3Q97_07125 [Bacteroidota bacterium]|nr:hypothetical protein [Bacteroidota bacterium]